MQPSHVPYGATSVPLCKLLLVELGQDQGTERALTAPGQERAQHGYLREVPCRTSSARAFAAVGTLAGLRGWWTPIVAGTARPGELLVFGFEDLDEAIVLRVDQVLPPALVHWTCLQHTGAPEWAGTSIRFLFEGTDAEQCVLTLSHLGLPAESVAVGWARFLPSLVAWAETGQGEPFRSDRTALAVARAYHRAWTSRNFDDARGYLAPDLKTDVPINSYTGRDDFAAAVATFGSLADRVELLAEFGTDNQALLLYDMHTQPLGRFRVAEHFTVDGGLIRQIRHVHDTAVLRGMS